MKTENDLILEKYLTDTGQVKAEILAIIIDKIWDDINKD